MNTLNMQSSLCCSLRSLSKCFKLQSGSLPITRQFTTSLKRCRAQIIDGKSMAKGIKDEVRAEVQQLIAAGQRPPQLTAIIVGDDPASHTYVRNKMLAAKYTGINSITVKMPDTISETELLQEIRRLNKDDSVDGILVQLPVPKHVRERMVCNAVAPEKDVDGFHVVNIGRLCVDVKSMIPATSAGVIEMIRRAGIETFGKNAVVCGRSKNVSMPIAMLLHSDGIGETDACDATTTICHRYTPQDQLRIFLKSADILVVATGIPGLIKADMLKEGVAVIDVGINRVKNEETGKFKIVGDVDFEGVSEIASFITPVPGGVGPMTVAMLMKNTLQAAKREIKYDWS